MNADQIMYALCEQVPQIAYCAKLETTYGGLTLSGADARKIAALVDKLLRARLKRIERAAQRWPR
jgi:hypothetical protein